jgi:mRNA-degrading endonuclease RelE of RelBE toxin-antitoxin system
MARPLLTVVETAEFIARASRLMSEEQRAQVVELLARDPEGGDIMQGTGGVRKVRVALAGRGKSGGARVIYYFHSDRLPVFALTVQAQRNAMAAVVKAIKQQLER